MPKYEVNEKALVHARHLIDTRRYVVRSRWHEAQPSANDQNAFLKSHTWDEYGAWHLGLKIEASDETKNRYAFGFGDLRRLHRSGLIACHFRAAEFDHKQVELAAHDLLLTSRPETPLKRRRHWRTQPPKSLDRQHSRVWGAA